MAVVGTTLDEEDELDYRALTQVMTVMDNVGRVRDAPGLYEVTSASGREYLVDAFERSCSCPDSVHRGRICKHTRRVMFEVGYWEIPAWIDPLAIDDGLGAYVRGEPRWSE